MKTVILRLLALSFLITFISCSKDDDKGNGGGAGLSARVTGTVVTPSGKTVPGARISASGFSVKSDTEGRFSISLPAGDHELRIYTGNGNIFMTKLPLTLTSGEERNLTTTQTKLEQIKALAYIPGQYDMIQVVIVDSLGYNATPIGVWDLDNPASINTYGAIFLNCGLLELGSGFMMNYNKYQNLLNYVTNYGSIYASDWAVECLTGDGNLRLAANATGNINPNHNHSGEKSSATCWSPMLGGFIEDSTLCTYKSGPDGFFTDAQVLDVDLINALGKDSVDILYDLQDWEMINLYDTPFVPIMTHQFFGPIALKADLNTSAAHGNIYFTTFHNQPQGVSNDVETILNYIILNL